MNEMELLLKQEVSDMEQGKSPVQNVLATIGQREQCLKDIKALAKRLGDTPEDEREELLDEMD